MGGNIITKSKKLYDESNELLLSIHQLLQEYYQASRAVDALLDEAIKQSLNEQAQTVLRQFNQTQLSNAARVIGLFRQLDEMDERFMHSGIASLYIEKEELPEDMLNAKAAAPGANRQDTQSRIKENHNLPAWFYYRSVCAIYVAGVFYTDYAILLTFLNKPPVRNGLVEYLMDFAKAVGMDLQGKIIPLTGMVESLLDISQTALEKEILAIRKAVTAWDRLFLVTDHLTLFSSHILTSGCMMDFAQKFLMEDDANFQIRKEGLTWRLPKGKDRPDPQFKR